MKLAKTLALGLALGAALSTPARSAVREEHVTGGALDLVWNPGLGLSNRLQPLTLGPADAGYNNPSGDHTVGLARSSMAPDSGGVILTCTEPGGLSDYSWEGWIFTGDGNSRRGLVVRADPTNEFNSCYQFVIQSGLFQLNFRKLVNQAPTTLGTWFANTLPGGVPAVNTWHRMKVLAMGNGFQCWWDDYELTGGVPIVDTAAPSLPTGYVGVYNFRFDQGLIAFLVDDLLLNPAGATAAREMSWGRLKTLYSK